MDKPKNLSMESFKEIEEHETPSSSLMSSKPLMVRVF
jgi:hypothetical protein